MNKALGKTLLLVSFLGFICLVIVTGFGWMKYRRKYAQICNASKFENLNMPRLRNKSIGNKTGKNLSLDSSRIVQVCKLKQCLFIDILEIIKGKPTLRAIPKNNL